MHIAWSSFWFGVVCAYVVPWLALATAAGVCFAIRDALEAQRKRARLRRAIHLWAQQTFGEEAALLAPGASVDDVAKALAAHHARRDAEAVEALLHSLKRGD